MTDQQPQKLADQLPAVEDIQAFSEHMVSSPTTDNTAAVLEFARQGHHGMALYVAGRMALVAGNRLAGNHLLTHTSQLIACLVAMRTTLDQALDLLEKEA